MRRSAVIVLLLLSLTGSGCSIVVSRAADSFGQNLSQSIMNQDDPELVRAALPTYIVLLDSFLQEDKRNPAILSAAATMYASYAAVFADDPERASRLTTRARHYGLEAMCVEYTEACGWREMDYDAFVGSLEGVRPKHAELLYAYGFSTLTYLQAHSSDWNTLAELPQAEALLKHYIEISGEDTDPAAYNYLGILLTLRPPALGGKPEEARMYFEKAIALSDGKDLGAKVEYAKGYAKLLYERELHDRLVREVLTANPQARGYTLMNVIAQQEARRLQAEADDYF